MTQLAAQEFEALVQQVMAKLSQPAGEMPRAAHFRGVFASPDEAVAAAQEMVKLAKERQASQLGVVLEYLLAREELTRARQSRVEAVAAFNKAQHELKRAVGKQQ